MDDSTGARIYHFKGHLAFPGQRWSMLDATGAEVATLVRPPLHIHPTFTVSRAGRCDVVIRKSVFAPMMESWRIEGAEDGDVDLRGDMLNHEFTFARRSDGRDDHQAVDLGHRRLRRPGERHRPGAGHRRRRRHRLRRAGAQSLTGHVESLGVGVPLDDHRPDRRRDG